MMKAKEKKKQVIREFPLTNLALANRTTVLILVFLISILGITAYINMPKEAFPEAVMPEIYVGTTYPGNSPLDMENLITRPIENEINTLSGVDKITSTSIQDYSTIIVKFQSDIEVEEALQDTKDAVDRAKKDLPGDLDQEPNVFDVNFSEFPVMNINLAGEFSNEELKEYADYLEDEIEKIPEISKVDIRGLQEKEVKVSVDIHKMASLEISFQDIENAIKAENITISGGNILINDQRRTIRVVGEFKDPSELNDVIVKHEKGNIVFLSDIASVNFEYAERTSYARNNTETVVMLDVVKRSGSNLLSAAKQINEILKDAKEGGFIPKRLEVSITNDMSKQTKSMVANLENSIISGVILVVLVLLFFLGTRNALFVGIAIPLSMAIAFFVLDSMGVTMNMMVLFSTILSLGMLVDNGIVVVENIYRLMDEGYPPIRAAREGVGEVAKPIIASTATTLAAFLPLAVWPGIMGEFMFYLPLGLMIVLSSSLFVALVINPVLTALFMRVGFTGTGNRKRLTIYAGIVISIGILLVATGNPTFGNVLNAIGLITITNLYFFIPGSIYFQQNIIPRIERFYKRILSFALRGRHPIYFFAGIILMLVLSNVLMQKFPPKTIFFPINEPRYVNVFIEQPIGTDIEETNNFTKEVEGKVIGLLTDSNYMPAVEAVLAQVGEGTSDPMEGPSQGITPHKSRVTIAFVDYQDRYLPSKQAGGDYHLSTTKVMEEVRDLLSNYPGVSITVDKDPAGPPMPKPINIEIVGEEFEVLLTEAEKMKKFLNEKNIDGIEELKLDVQSGSPELIVEIDRKKARRFGVSSQRIAMEMRTALFGKEVSKYKVGKDEYPIQLRLDDKYRYNVEALMNQKVTFRDQSNGKIVQVPISSLATTNLSSSYSSVKRKNLDRAVTIFSNINADNNENVVVDDIKTALIGYELPAGYTFKFTGQQEEQAKEMAFLSRALMIALFLIFIIIVSQFNSFSTPFIIMASVLFSTIGVFLGLMAFQMDFVVIMTMMGIISLAGIVVNNAIVLLDYTGLVQ
ncbi:MAG: efflux RND transporter permease subunit, partial [Bacteroidetes bacterium]|nr:efflux RND transporter permease subunit [Bacteroidota bacterium]